MLKEKNIATRIWDIVYPLAMYYAVTVIAMFVAQLIFGSGNERYVLRQIVANVVTLPVMYVSFYKKDAPFGEKRAAHAALIVISAACLGVGLNNLILMSPLASVSTGYAEASSHFYGSTLLLELVGSALLAPVLEELVYRGIIYARLKRMIGFLPAVFLSSLIFALMHFNLVQFVYAFLFGIALALYMEGTGHMYGAVIGHVTANAIAVLRTETGILSGTMDKSLSAWLISVGICLIGVGFLCVWRRLAKRSVS